jgi:hypothetical protein
MTASTSRQGESMEHPWQSGPTELIRYALSHLQGQSAGDQRIAFLLLDVAVETTLKTYLQLDEDVTGTKVSFAKRREACEGNFHDLVRGIKEAAGERLKGINLSHIRYYHDLRNRLYHEGNGITVPSDKAKAYARLTVDILLALLDVDLRPELDRPEQNLAEREAKDRLLETIWQEKTRLAKQIEVEIRNLSLDLRIIVEGIDSELVSPSFEQWYVSSLTERQRYAEFLMDEVRHCLSSDAETMTIAETVHYLEEGGDDFIVDYFLDKLPGVPQCLCEFANTHFTSLDLLRVLSYSSFFGLLAEIINRTRDSWRWSTIWGWGSEREAGGELLDDTWPSIDPKCTLDDLNRILEEVRRSGEQRLSFLRDAHSDLTSEVKEKAESK